MYLNPIPLGPLTSRGKVQIFHVDLKDRQGVSVRVQMHSQTFHKHSVYLIMI